MIETPRLGKTYYMTWYENNGRTAGLYKVELKRQLGEPSKLFYKADIVDLYFDDVDRSVKNITTVRSDLYSSFNSALDVFKQKTKYNEQDIIVYIFENRKRK